MEAEVNVYYTELKERDTPKNILANQLRRLQVGDVLPDVNRKSLFRHCNQCSWVDVFDRKPRKLERKLERTTGSHGLFSVRVLSCDNISFRNSDFRLASVKSKTSQQVHSPNLLKRKCMSKVPGIERGSIIIFHLSKL